MLEHRRVTDESFLDEGHTKVTPAHELSAMAVPHTFVYITKTFQAGPQRTCADSASLGQPETPLSAVTKGAVS